MPIYSYSKLSTFENCPRQYWYGHIEKPDIEREQTVEAFKTATLENARNSLQEPGIARLDVIQQPDDPTRFVLVEVYRSSEDTARHKETKHYQKWRDTVADMMAEPRTSVKYMNVFPDEGGWG